MMYKLSEEQRMMRDSCRAFADEVITPFIRDNWRREWDMNADARLPREILEAADKVGIRTLGIPEEFGGIELDPKTEVQTFAIIAEEIARGDCGLADKLVQNWKISVLLRHLAPRHLQEHWFTRLIDEPQIAVRPLPDRAARRLGPLASLQRARSRHAHPRREAAATNGSSTAASSSSPTATTPASMSSMPTPTQRSACFRARPPSSCRATRPASPWRAATRQWAAGS